MSNSSIHSTASSDDDYNPENVIPQKIDPPSTVSDLTSADDISHLPSKPSPHSNVKEDNQVEMFKQSFLLSNNDENKSNTDNEPPVSNQSIVTTKSDSDNDGINDAPPPDQDINVPLFNSVIQFFISSPLLNDPQFISLTPSDKEYVVLKAYNDSNNLQESIKINFAATTSYNKSHLKPNEERQLLVPINPYCLRPDLTQPMSADEKLCYDEFKKENERFFRESECSHFPPGSRLFVGNLAVNTLNISDVFRVFHPYGKIKSVNLKQGYGFVQFTTADACNLAIKCEQNVPLHNRFMHLQISKQHDKNSERNQHREERRTKDRERERSPMRNNNNIRERSPVRGSNKIQVIITNESEPSFNHLMVNSLNEVGLETNIKHVESTAEELAQQTIFDCAYTGVIAVIITTKLELVNLVLFEKNEDDAIKFDEYADISMESAINWILNSAKKSKSNNGNDSNINTHSHNNNNNSNYNHSNNNNNRRGRVQNSNQQLYNNDRRQRDRGGRNKNNDNRNRNNKKSFYASSQDQGNQYNDQYSSYRSDASNQSSSYYAQPQTLPQQLPPSADVTAQLANSLKSMDPNSINTMLSFVQQLQQPQPQQQQQLPPPPQPQPQQQYIPQQQPSGPGAVLGNLLNQLQTSPSGINPPPPNYLVQQPQHQQYQSNPSYAYSNGYPQQQQQPLPSHSQQQQYYPPLQQVPPVTTQASQPQRQPQDDKDGDDASKLFETLARLKNNM